MLKVQPPHRRFDQARSPTKAELKATTVLKLTIESASLKVRAESANDDKADYANEQLANVWSGVVPMRQNVFGEPQADPKVQSPPPISDNIAALKQGASFDSIAMAKES